MITTTRAKNPAEKVFEIVSIARGLKEGWEGPSSCAYPPDGLTWVGCVLTGLVNRGITDFNLYCLMYDGIEQIEMEVLYLPFAVNTARLRTVVRFDTRHEGVRGESTSLSDEYVYSCPLHADDNMALDALAVWIANPRGW